MTPEERAEWEGIVAELTERQRLPLRWRLAVLALWGVSLAPWAILIAWVWGATR